MKTKISLLFQITILLLCSNLYAQVGIGIETPATSAALEVSSKTNNKGILIPRITAMQKDAISNPAEGLMIYQTSAPTGFYFYTGNSWILLVSQIDLDLKVAKVSGKDLSSNDFTTAEKTKLSAITGSNTGDQDLSALATTASVALKANAADLTSGLATKVDKVTGKDLSSNDYTTAEKNKLAAITGTNTGDQTTITGNAGTATKLATSININGVAFDGSSAITVAADANTLSGTAIKSTVTGSSLTSVGTLANLTVTAPIAGSVTGTASNVTGIVAIANGGTNSTATPTAGGIGYGSGTALGYTAAGTAGQVLSSNNTGIPTWITPSSVAVPYTGAIAAVDLGAYDLKVNDLTIGKGGGSMATNTAIGTDALFSNTTGSSNTAIGYGADVATGALTNATAIGAGAIVNTDNTIQLGNTSVLNVKTSGTITAGAVTYPNISGSNGQVLTSAGDGTSNWTSGGLPTADAPGQMLFWNGNIWVKVGAGNEGATLIFTRGKPTWSLAYEAVTSATGKIWMDRNLGASQVATSITDSASYGDLYQWGRGTDGHQFRASATTTVLSSIDQPDNSLFIKVTSPNLDWRSSQNNNLWQGLSGVNNPCPSGYRLPTEIEFNLEIATWAPNPFASPLKWTMGGYRSGASGELKLVGTRGYYFTGTASLVGYARGVGLISSGGYISDFARAGGFSVRCIKDYL